MEALDSPPRYQTAMDDGTDGLSSRGHIEIKFESNEVAEATENVVIAASALPPTILIADESPSSRGNPSCTEQRFNLGFSRDWNMSEK